ncbi:MAG: tRNA 4-thiouridine(8) synthase ThiI [Lachnospiraceae bacterium]|nr:tRNA 4-thiouridine(8) synthase ThiI [Lachnospiraceae bacterium]MBP5275272.1 tRNA 4-thiouridine(8) synthase ThiI [Lachnospiraceae bacterium]MBP5564767.1 tRNA 4-thiouridine(8) synthase ThiI [Lachnospiraceae bacterium]MBQ4276109.1 tRNA 4-thiouridine(8) synthase ThiI [Lachnospiraceae bacterium]MCR4696323.1 tRNA 4-thiouridine(8) synthase ThiI [Lachnospiraceae bacterium]
MSNQANKTYLIKYGEIFLKGKNRYIFEDALVARITEALERVEGEFRVHKFLARIYVESDTDFDEDELLGALTKVFGITAICPTLVLEDNGFDDLKEQVVKYVKDTYEDTNFTFKMLCKRARKNYPVDSQEMNCLLGEVLLDAYPGLKVDVHNPDVLIKVEIRERVYVYSKSIPGPGGMPVGTAGNAMALLSGGLDSPVAAYMIAKRGVKIEAVYFHAPPYTSERAKEKVVDLAKKISVYTGKMKLHVINFTDIQMAIYQKCPPDELTIIMRRYMMRIAEHIAKENKCIGLITGESIGQVASQTMQSLLCTNAVCELPVYRPLIAFDKQDIVDIAEKIDTYETSVLPYEDCCTIFVAKHPVTKPILGVIEMHEHNLDDCIEEMLNKAINEREVIDI